VIGAHEQTSVYEPPKCHPNLPFNDERA
jgi:hypothetical protein